MNATHNSSGNQRFGFLARLPGVASATLAMLALAGCPTSVPDDTNEKPPTPRTEPNTAPPPKPPATLRAAVTDDGSTALGFDRTNRAVLLVRAETTAYMTDGRVRLAFDNGVRAQFDRTADGARWLSLFSPGDDADSVVVFRAASVAGGGTQIDVYEAPAATFNPSASGALTGLMQSSKGRGTFKVLAEIEQDKSEWREASSASWGDCFLNPDLAASFGCLRGAILDTAMDHLNSITGGFARAADRFGNVLGWERWASMRLVANWSKNLTDVFRDGDIRTSDLLSNAVDWDGMMTTARGAVVNQALRHALGNDLASRVQTTRRNINLVRDTVVPTWLLPDLADPPPPREPNSPREPNQPPPPREPNTRDPNTPNPPSNPPSGNSLPALVQSGQVTFYAASQSGFSQTRLKLTNQTGSTFQVDVSTAAFVPHVGTGQRVGLTRPLSQFGGQANPEPDAPAAAGTSPPYVVELAPRATVDLIFGSRCLDHGRGSPSGSYAIFYAPLPDFITQALRANTEQGALWNLIDRTDPDWGDDPRSNGRSYLFTFKNHTGGHLRLTARPFGGEYTYALAPGQEATLEMAFRPSSFDYEAEPSGAGEPRTWSGLITPGGGRSEALRLTLSSDYYVLRIRNNSSHRVGRMVTNKGLQSERTHTVDIPNDGALWNMGFHRRFSNSNLHLYDGSYHWEFNPVTYRMHSEHGYAYAEYTLVD